MTPSDIEDGTGIIDLTHFGTVGTGATDMPPTILPSAITMGFTIHGVGMEPGVAGIIIGAGEVTHTMDGTMVDGTQVMATTTTTMVAG